MAGYERREIGEFVFEIGHIDPLVSLEISERGAKGDLPLREMVNTMLANTFFIEGDKRFPFLKIYAAKLLGHPRVLKDVIKAAEAVIYAGFLSGDDDAEADQPSPPQSETST